MMYTTAIRLANRPAHISPTAIDTDTAPMTRAEAERACNKINRNLQLMDFKNLNAYIHEVGYGA